VRWDVRAVGKHIGGRKEVGVRWNVPMINQEIGVHAHSIGTVRQGLVERVFRVVGPDGGLVVPPRPEPHVFGRRLSWFTNEFCSKVRVVRPLSRSEFLATYSGRRRNLYDKAADEFHKRGVRKSDSTIRAFVKIEALTKSLGGRLAQNIVPRIIQPRNPRLPVYGYALGRFIKVYEHIMKEIVADIGEDISKSKIPVILKGINAHKRALMLRKAWELYDDPVAVSMDASRFDQHVSKDALKWEAARWLSFCPYDQRSLLQKLLKMQLENRGIAVTPEGRVRYKTDGCRMSGDMNTSAGNCLIMSSMLLTYVHDKKIHCNVFNDGDDSVIIMERKDYMRFRAGLTEWFRDMGFTMEVEDVVDVFEKIDFCQCQPVLRANGYTMVRNPHKALAKDLTHVTNFATEADVKNWLSAVGACGLAMTDGIPVYQAFYQCFEPDVKARIPEELKDRGFYHMSAGTKWTNMDICVESRVSFYKAFGITPDDQEMLERHFGNIVLSKLPVSGPGYIHNRVCSPLHPRI
jgi:hypothetical protein